VRGAACGKGQPNPAGRLRAHPDEAVLHLHRGLRRVAASIEAGDLCLAGIGAVLLGFPDLKPGAMAKLAEIADLEKDGAAWENEARVPAGQVGGGQWTADRGGAAAAGVKPAGNSSNAEDTRPARAALPLDDGVYRPGADDPSLISIGAEEDEEPPKSNGPPADFTRRQDVFPGLGNVPGMAIPLAPIDAFFGISGLANEADLEAALGQYNHLIAQIKAVNPNFVDEEILPPGGIAGLSREGRNNLIDGLRMQRAVAFYKLRGDVGPLQVETLRFLQKAVDKAYAKGVDEFNAGGLDIFLSREEAIGNFVDDLVRFELRSLFSSYGVPYGSRAEIAINNRDYDTSGPNRTYTVPDARIRDVSFDWTLTLKTISTPQIRGFFGANSRPWAVVIIRPSQLGRNSTYLIPRPASLAPRR
jgi:hypothetical protein